MNRNDERVFWIALNLCISESPRDARRLLSAFPAVEDIFRASPRDLAELGVREDVLRGIQAGETLEAAKKELEKLEKKAYTLLTLRDDGYPPLLKEIYDPPLVLACSGRSEVLTEPAVAIVGSRKPTAYGRAVAEKIAEELASRGVVVVSGLARGIDASAHRGAMRKGRTVAVLGSGLDRIYPDEHRGLAESIRGEGAVVSEYPLAAPPLAFHFPLRNRIISGLVRGLVVVEASERSGSLISARLALEENREVMAVPGNVTSEQSRGTNGLIRNGARLVSRWEDVADALPSPLREDLLSKGTEERPEPPLDDVESKVYGVLSPGSETPIDGIADATGFSISVILAVLLSLELKGLVVQNPGKVFLRRM